MPRFLIALFLILGFGSLHAQDNPIIEIKRIEKTNSSIIIEGVARVVPPNTKMRVTVQRINGQSIEERHTIKTVEDVFTGSDGSFTATLKRYGSLNGFDFPAGKYQLEFYAGFSRAWQTMEVAKKAGVRLDEQGRSDLGEPRSLPKSSDLVAQDFLGEKVRFLQAIRTITIQASNASSARAAAPIKKEKGRRLTGEECARMERLVPETANYLGMRGNGTKLIEAGKKGDFPEAFEAMFSWVSSYNTESLLKHGYEMAPDFYNKCKNGTIRAPL